LATVTLDPQEETNTANAVVTNAYVEVIFIFIIILIVIAINNKKIISAMMIKRIYSIKSS
jgi:hypothetical protein